MKLTEIQELIKFVSKSNVSEVELETKEFKIIIKTGKSTAHNNGHQQVLVQNAPPLIPTALVPATLPLTETSASSAQSQKTKENKASDIPSEETNEEKKYHIVKSPMIGTFYRSSSPDKPPFVNIGDTVEAGQPLCIIEAMKLFNEIESDAKGKIVKILVDNATPIEYDQPLFLIDTNI